MRKTRQAELAVYRAELLAFNAEEHRLAARQSDAAFLVDIRAAARTIYADVAARYPSNNLPSIAALIGHRSRKRHRDRTAGGRQGSLF